MSEPEGLNLNAIRPADPESPNARAAVTKRCPFCAEEILAAALKCKHCGSVLEAPAQSEPSVWKRDISMGKLLGSLLLLAGLCGAFYYWQVFDTSVETPVVQFMGQAIGGGRVHNIGLMQERQTGLLVSGGGVSLGLILLLVSKSKRGAQTRGA
jgi:hypothetical protein